MPSERFAGFRLNPDNEDDALILERLKSLQPGKAGDYVKRLILADIEGLMLLFDLNNKRDQTVIEALRKIPDNRHSEYLLDMVYERLTGVDARTGQHLEGRVTVIEKQIPIIQERVKVVEVPVYISSGEVQSIEQHEQPPDDDLNTQAHKRINDIEW